MLYTFYVPLFGPTTPKLYCVQAAGYYDAKNKIGSQIGIDPYRLGHPEIVEYDPLEMVDNDVASMPLRQALLAVIRIAASDAVPLNDLVWPLKVLSTFVVENNSLF